MGTARHHQHRTARERSPSRTRKSASRRTRSHSPRDTYSHSRKGKHHTTRDPSRSRRHEPRQDPRRELVPYDASPSRNKRRYDEQDGYHGSRYPARPEPAYRSAVNPYYEEYHPVPEPPEAKPYTYKAYDSKGSRRDEFEFDDDKPLSRRRVFLAGLGQFVFILLGPAILPCLIAAQHMPSPVHGLPLWSLDGEGQMPGFPLFIVCPWGWVVASLAMSHVFLVVKFDLLDKLRDKSFRPYTGSMWLILGADIVLNLCTLMVAGYLMYAETRKGQCFVPASNIGQYQGCGLLLAIWFFMIISVAFSALRIRFQAQRIRQWKAVLDRCEVTEGGA